MRPQMAGMADTGISALLIDRSPEMRGNLRAMLGQCGIEDVQPAANAAAAIRKLGERAFDLILCEYALGEGQDGQQRGRFFQVSFYMHGKGKIRSFKINWLNTFI